MFARLKAHYLFRKMLGRPDIQQAYKMVGPEDSWYDTITTVHNSLVKIRELPGEQLQMTSHDGFTLKAVYYPGNSQRTMIWIHGYTSHGERESAFPGLFYHSLGFNVLIPYLRAHGPSEGTYISFGPKEADDLKQWVDVINEKHPDGQILIHGLSMGGGIALDLATQELENVKCFVVDAPSWSIAGFLEGVASYTFKKDGKAVEKHLMNRYERVFGVDARKFDRTENIKKGRYPLLLSAGSMEQQEGILEKICENNPKGGRVLILPGCNHGNGMYKQTEMYQSAIREFIKVYFVESI